MCTAHATVMKAASELKTAALTTSQSVQVSDEWNCLFFGAHLNFMIPDLLLSSKSVVQKIKQDKLSPLSGH